MSHTEQVEQMTDIMARFVGYTSKVLPDDVAEGNRTHCQTAI